MRRFLIATVALAAILAGCSSDDSKQPAGPKPLVMGTQPDFPPFEHLGGANGEEVIGFDVDVAKAIAAKLGRPLQIEQLKFDALIPALNAGEAAGGVPSIGRSSWLPSMNTTQYKAMASAKFAAGPAATIRLRLPTDCRLKARSISSGATSPSRSSSILT